VKRLISFCLVLVFACGGDGGPTGPDDDTGIIRILNSSSISLVEVNISRCEVEVWGGNRITSPIDVGRSRDFELTPDCYDVRVVGSTTEEVQFFDLVLTRGVTLPITIFSN
jgi:hypothetical protein